MFLVVIMVRSYFIVFISLSLYCGTFNIQCYTSYFSRYFTAYIVRTMFHCYVMWHYIGVRETYAVNPILLSLAECRQIHRNFISVILTP